MMLLILIALELEHVPKIIKEFINRPLSSASQNKNIKANIFRIQAYDSVMCGYFCIWFIDFIFKGKTLTTNTKTLNTNLSLPNNFEKNYDIISK